MITIRDGRPDDAEGLMEVHRRSILALGQGHYSQAELESWAAKLTPEGYGQAMDDGESYLVAESDVGVLAAFCTWKDDEVIGLYVNPNWARRGIAGDLLARAEARMAAAGQRRLHLRASLSGRAFYQAKGYRVTSHATWATRGGLVIATLRMEKTLD